VSLDVDNAEPMIETKTSKVELDHFHKLYGFQISPSLDEVQRYQALEILYCYKSVFTRDTTEIKECKGPPLTLELHTDQKMFKR